MRPIYVVFAFLTFFATQVFAGDLSPEQVDGATTVDTAKAKQLFDDGVLFVDTRKDSDWDAGRIPDAVHLELKSNFTEASLTAEVDKSEPIVCYCNGHKCMRSSKCSAKAVGWGFTQVYYYRDGFPAWTAAGNPVE
ncbi:MAG: rhodanese-like domain-containing protein [Cellvibrionaceae bacterium]|nr:rhodanese-like domain-containing protein [Cellvibrionaceae bacterium]